MEGSRAGSTAEKGGAGKAWAKRKASDWGGVDSSKPGREIKAKESRDVRKNRSRG